MRQQFEAAWSGREDVVDGSRGDHASERAVFKRLRWFIHEDIYLPCGATAPGGK